MQRALAAAPGRRTPAAPSRRWPPDDRRVARRRDLHDDGRRRRSLPRLRRARIGVAGPFAQLGGPRLPRARLDALPRAPRNVGAVAAGDGWTAVVETYACPGLGIESALGRATRIEVRRAGAKRTVPVRGRERPADRRPLPGLARGPAARASLYDLRAGRARAAASARRAGRSGRSTSRRDGTLALGRLARGGELCVTLLPARAASARAAGPRRCRAGRWQRAERRRRSSRSPAAASSTTAWARARAGRARRRRDVLATFAPRVRTGALGLGLDLAGPAGRRPAWAGREPGSPVASQAAIVLRRL